MAHVMMELPPTDVHAYLASQDMTAKKVGFNLSFIVKLGPDC